MKSSILIVEGVWGVGKSTLIKRLLSDHSTLKFLREPEYPEATLLLSKEKKIFDWYFEKHIQNIEKARLIQSKKKNSVVIERSVVSSLAYAEVILGWSEHQVAPYFFKAQALNIKSENFILLHLVNIDRSILRMRELCLTDQANYETLRRMDNCLKKYSNLLGL
ncbi:MAG: P-loop NTPase fold protein [Patescibacteria group bacterium]|jgi:thymidylate kinase